MRVLLTEWARLMFRSLVDAGLQDLTICPGARSLPFALAAVNTEGLRCRSALDERAAAFFALGQARATGRPSAVLCTSGSAAAHFFPAVVEAAADHLPMILITADRPPELHECGSAQTMDQLKLFGPPVRRFFEVGLPDTSELALRALRRMAGQAVFACRHPDPGPVHLNVRARKPLEPAVPESAAESELAARVRAVGARPIVRVSAPRPAADPEGLRAVASLLRERPRGLIVCGALPTFGPPATGAIAGLAARTGYPVLAEATSQVRFGAAAELGGLLVDGFDRLLEDERFPLQPEVIVQVGTPPSGLGWERFVAGQSDAEVVVLSAHGWRDPFNLATHLVFGDVASSVAALRDLLEARGDRPAAPWARRLAAANALVWRAVEEELAGQSELSEGAAARAVVGNLPPGSALFLGNSLPLRLADSFCRGSNAGLAVLSQRGVNGIDGCLAGVIGSASVMDRPLTALVGDLTFLHDVGALALLERAPARPLVLVVLQNNGGRIFEQLPTGKLVREHEGPFVFTPQDLPLAPAAALYGTRYRRVASAAALAEAVREAHLAAAVTLIEAVVPPHGAAADAARIGARLRRLLEEELAP